MRLRDYVQGGGKVPADLGVVLDDEEVAALRDVPEARPVSVPRRRGVRSVKYHLAGHAE